MVPWWARHSAFPRQELKEMVEAEVEDMAELQRERFFALCDSKCEPGKNVQSNAKVQIPAAS